MDRRTERGRRENSAEAPSIKRPAEKSFSSAGGEKAGKSFFFFAFIVHFKDVMRFAFQAR